MKLRQTLTENRETIDDRFYQREFVFYFDICDYLSRITVTIEHFSLSLKMLNSNNRELQADERIWSLVDTFYEYILKLIQLISCITRVGCHDHVA